MRYFKLRPDGFAAAAFLPILLVFIFLSGCVGRVTGDNLAPGSLTVLTSSLPNGQTGTLYAANLAAKGGETPYTWSLS